MRLLTKFYLYSSWFAFVGGTIAWPICQFTVAKNEPPFLLALSFLAIIYAGLSSVIAAEIKKEQEKK